MFQVQTLDVQYGMYTYMYPLNYYQGGGFKYFFMFTPIWGRFPI